MDALKFPKKIKVVLLSLVGLIFLASGAAFSWWYFQETPLTSPLSSLTTFNFINRAEPGHQKVVYGFLPYWNMDEVQLQPELTHLAYFALTIGADGTIITRTDDGLEPGYRHLQSDEWLELSSTVADNQGQVELVLAQFDNDTIISLLNSDQAQQNLLRSLDSILLSYPVSGINLDIEYSGEVTPHLKSKLVALVTAIKQHIDQRYQGVELSIDMYASAAEKNHLWDVAAIEPEVDYIVVMAYDFHRRSSAQAGPVAPLFGGKDYWDSDINQNLVAFTKIVPHQKLLLGIPFYGYEWQTISREAQAHTFPDTGATASYKRVRQILSQTEELAVEEGWNEEALSPYLSYLEDDQIYVVYYENSRSLSYKLDYINQLNLGGAAIWALGYEDDSRELWDVINRKL